MDDRLSGTDHSWFKYFPNAIKSVLSCRSQNVVKTARDVLCVVRYYKPDPTPYQRALLACWTNTARVLCRDVVAVIVTCLWRAADRGWRLVRLSVQEHLLTAPGRCPGAPAEHRRTAGPPEGTPRDATDGGGCDRVQCEVLYDPGPGSALVDVVFIHGLRGDKLKTWKQGVWKQQVGQRPEPVVVRSGGGGGGGGNRAGLSAAVGLRRPAADERVKEFTDCWPRDWLPLDCPYVRVIAISYSTDPYLWRPIWLRKPVRTTMKDRGLEMISLLKDVRVGHNPITWVGHSKGGLFIKQILVHANENRKTQPMITNTRGILFYSVPHNGSPLANIKLPLFQRSIELQELVNDTQDIQILQNTFQEMMNCNRQIQVKSFIETKLTLMKLIYLRIVSIQSADPGFGDLYGVPLDHRNICKPKNRNCFLYQELVNMIHSLKQLTLDEPA